MPIHVCFVFVMQKKSKNEVAQKIPKKYLHRKSPPAGGWSQEVAPGPQAPSRRVQGPPARGGLLGDLGTASDSPFSYKISRDAETRDIQPFSPEALPISAAIET